MSGGQPDSAGRAGPALRIRLVFLLYAGLTIALAFPVLRHAADRVQSPGADTDLYLWTLAWDTHAFTHQPLSIFDANIFHPQRRTLAYSENVIGSAIVAAPIIWLTHNPVLALNLVPLLACALCGVGAYLLARRLRIGPAGAVVSGLVFAFAPPRFLRLDQLFLATVHWMPFSLASLHAYLDRGDRRDLRLAIAFFMAQAVTSGHGAVFLALAAAIVLAWHLSCGHRLAITKRVRDVGIVGVLLLVPVLLIAIPYARVQAEIGLKRTLDDWRIVSAASFLASPTYVHAFLADHLLPEAHINDRAGAYLFPGVIPLLLCAVALIRPATASAARSSRSDIWRHAALVIDVVFVVGVALGLAVALTGPARLKIGTLVLYSAREPWRAWLLAAVSLLARIVLCRRVPFDPVRHATAWLRGTGRWLTERRNDPATPYVLLIAVTILLAIGPPFSLWPYVYSLPGFSFIRAPSRFTLAGVLGVGVLAGAGFDRLTRRLSPSASAAAGAAAAVLLAAEFVVPLGTTAYRVTIPAADAWLARQPTPFVVAEVPLPELTQVALFEARQAEFMLHSTAHWQKTVHGWSGFLTLRHLDLYDQLTRFPDDASLRALTDVGVDYLIVHTNLYAPGEWRLIEPRLTALGTRLELRYADDAGRVYAIVRQANGRESPTDPADGVLPPSPGGGGAAETSAKTRFFRATRRCVRE